MADFLRDRELDQLVAELNSGSAPPVEDSAPEAPPLTLPATPPAPPPRSAPALDAPRLHRVESADPLARILKEMVVRGASDLLLVPGEPPVLRLDGQLVKAEAAELGSEELRALFRPHLSERLQQNLREHGGADFSIVLDGNGGGTRFRVNLHRQRGRLAAALRALPRQVPTLEALHLPPALARLVQPLRGLVLVCGATGAGKTTTLAALVGEINRRRACHVLTIEDPIEYEHENQQAIVEQIEVGVDAPSFASALRACLRQDPDVILVGEMRDLETIATALTAAETGHLILSTLHTSDVAQAVHRIVDVFPAVQQGQIRHQLAMSLTAVVCQQLVPRADGAGRLPAVEVLVANYAVRNHIRKDTLQNLYTEITLGKRQGAVSLEDSLAALVRSGAVNREEAFLRATRPDELESLLRR